jgi:plasmid maintenance system killer protein
MGGIYEIGARHSSRLSGIAFSSNPHCISSSHQDLQDCESLFPLPCSLFGLQYCSIIKSFADLVTEKIFLGEELTKNEARQLSDILIDKAQERLVILHHSSEKNLLTLHSLHYHKLHGAKRYSIDANTRSSKWRITFAWANPEPTDVSLVKIEDTH